MATEHTQRERERSGPYAAAVRWMENLSDAQFAYLLLTPALLLLALIAFWPLLSTFEMSLRADALYSPEPVGDYVGLENYIQLLTGGRNAVLTRPFLPTGLSTTALLQSALTITLIFTVVSVLFETLIGFGQALVLDQNFRGRRWVRVAIIIPWAIPIVIQGMIFYLFFQPNVGFATNMLSDLGVLSTTPLANTRDSLFIVIVADIWKTSAFMALLILAGLQSIDRSLYDVAKVAGASKWQQFKFITFPLVLPTVLVAMLFRTIDAMRVFGLIETVSNCSAVPSLSCLVVSTWNSQRIGTSAAIAFLTAAIIAIVVAVYIIRYAREDVGGA